MTKVNPREGKTWPAYILGGRLRTSTLLLLIAFIGIGWVYHNWDTPARAPQQVPATEVVPPGFIPDPAYTWAPRTNFQRPTTATTTTTPTTTESATPTTTPGEEPHGPTPSGEPTSPGLPPSPPVTTPVPSGPPPGPPVGPPPPAPPPGA